MTASMKRVRAAIDYPANAEALVIKTRLIVEKMSNNSWFPQPFPALAKVDAAAQTLHDAQTATLTKTRGLATKRNATRAALVNLLEQLKKYVEGIANENLEYAVSIIESAGMDAVLPRHAEKAPFAVDLGKPPRSVVLKAKAGPKGTRYDWQMSTNGGETWVDLGGTTQATKTVPNLELGQTYWFRVRLLKPRLGFTEWSDKIWIVVR